ncbi:hypothetical protein P9366_20940, partial [Escherichia coli]
DRNRSHWSTSKTPSYTKSVSWQHHPYEIADYMIRTKSLLSAKELAAILEKEYPHLDVDNASIYQNEAGGVRRAR